MVNEILNKYLNNEKSITFTNYSLESITSLLKEMGDPHRNFRSVHITGTNGKGTTAFITAQILEKSGYKTGLYISPHLLRINERIQINSEEISENTLNNYLNEIDSIVQTTCQVLPTYFDILTASAFKYFSDESIDIAIIETGLGGKLDSTNVLIPDISIITDISLDHMHILGDTYEKITVEKCGIIKQGRPVITSNIIKSIVSIIEQNSLNNQSELYLYNRDYYTENISFNNGIYTFDFIYKNCRFKKIQTRLFPQHQIMNTATALTAVNILRSNGYPNVNNENIYTLLKTLHVPGRFEFLSENPLIIYDPAHNYNALKNLINGINELYSDNKIIFIISLMADKAEYRTLDIFNKNNVIYYTLNDTRAYIPEENRFTHVVSDPNFVINLMKTNYNEKVIYVFTGTFRIYESALKITSMLKNTLQADKKVRRDYETQK